MVRFDLGIELAYDVRGESHFVFNIGAAATPAQRIVTESISVNLPATTTLFEDAQHGNRMARLKAPAGHLAVQYRATVDIDHVFADPARVRETPVGELPSSVLPFVLPSRYCPSDRMVQSAHDWFGAMPPGYARVDAIRQWVNERIRFKIGTSSTATSALDTLVEGRGVCRDFAHLMITLCRGINVPARFVTGIDYGADPSLGPCDFHAYVEAFLDGRWYLFDPTGISPTTGLVRIGTGRDAADVAFCTAFGPVQCQVPRLSIATVADPARDLHEPVRTDRAVSTADASPPRAHAAQEAPGVVIAFPTPSPTPARQYA